MSPTWKTCWRSIKAHNPQRPLVCLDETSKQLIVETRAPIPAKQGRKARHDYEYKRNGVANLFMVFAPLEGWRHVKVSDRHTAIDYAHTLRDLSDVHFPDAVKIVLVQDNLNTHKPASLYEAFPAPEAGCEFQPIDHHSVVAVAQGHSFKPTIRVGEALFAAFDRDDAVGQIDAIKPFL